MIIIATPTRGEISARTAFDLMALVRKSPQAQWIVAEGTYLTNLRTQLVNQAVDLKASHILFIDSDMRFPPDALEKLLAHKKDIVGANYMQRTQPEYIARKNNEFVSSKDKKGLEEVDTIGFGVTLVDMTVFTSPLRAVGKNAFSMPFDVQVGKFVGEDVYFCTVAREKGFKVWVDHDLSNQVKHLGVKEL